MSTILDALRKAQTGNGEQPPTLEGEAQPAAAPPEDLHLPSFDDEPPIGRVAPARGPTPLLAAGVAALGLLLGVGAASFFTGGGLSLPLGGRDTLPSGAEPGGVATGIDADAEGAAVVASRQDATRARRDRRRAEATEQRATGTGSGAVAAAPVPSSSAPSAEALVAKPAPLEGGAPAAPASEASENAELEVAATLTDGIPSVLSTPPADTSAARAPAAEALQAPGAAPAQLAAVPSPAPAVAAGGAAPAPGTAPAPAVAPGPGTVIAPGSMPAPGAAPAPGTVPAAGAAPQVASVEPIPGLLETAPTGAPEVSLLFIKWSSSVERRVASLRGPGGRLMLVHEGDIIEGMRVGAIRPDSIELQWRGTSFLLLAAR